MAVIYFNFSDIMILSTYAAAVIKIVFVAFFVNVLRTKALHNLSVVTFIFIFVYLKIMFERC